MLGPQRALHSANVLFGKFVRMAGGGGNPVRGGDSTHLLSILLTVNPSGQ